ncbi:putative CRISPR-associated protein [Caldivirga maquilingensis]|uniref:Putative CRISPR-associated protein, APE2256 family n=1 Tax=Caldivirga maquilingensis (strain ATCC 700844 / DSM 13496 / JCM 10307 / IC-167) TaxID=397948 RepID=A8M9B4_CALMQ|nr:putative CRISPR-associated protein [Caldivirga maquilingensis]ABW02333.1 putative CRISPR-associated protein, APE2256 family [Caldivirga maquilingensis IC-167]
MKLAVLSTVGTSILSNMEATIRNDIERGVSTIDLTGIPEEIQAKLKEGKLSKLGPDDPLQEKIEHMRHRGDSFFEKTIEFVRNNPEGTSAELNTLIRFLLDFPYRQFEELEIYLYPTDTGTGKFCAQVIKEYLDRYGNEFMQKAGINIKPKVDEPIVVKDLGRDINWFNEGLIELVNKFARLIINKTRSGYKVVVNATAGYKPETAYIALVAQLTGAWKIIYMHESFKSIVELPKLPLTIQEKYIEALKIIGNGTLQNILKQMGIDVNDLIERGLVTNEEGIIKPREWIQKLINTLQS